ncbi:TetR/AcrR family transcriptional regulator [Lutibacter sp.]|uniref:TetR/AcrR family transcriptional regulator n=1 Tax=Lutibacter sp. TaxID=1925666 RepID=UPI0025BB288E|nr:TetR/AcrR family transcriptional regulator [Lutibacter sp.]MCF6182488.1 TetR/AcrR family transcriptional regulator [Lutibacter sp.]
MAKRVKSNEKRTALLNATLSLINNNGFHDAPMSKIAKLADISPATIYIYFECKQDLINQLYLEVKAAFSKHAFLNFTKELPVKKGFENIWYQIADFKLTHVEESNFLSLCDNAPMVDDHILKKGLKHLQPLLILWERGQKEGIIKPISLYILYAFTIYPLAFLTNMKQKKACEFDKIKLDEAFLVAWDSIKV